MITVIAMPKPKRQVAVDRDNIIWGVDSASLLFSMDGFNAESIFSYRYTVDSWRTCGMVLLVTALGGAWSLEQPSGSLLEYYPLWREMLQHIFESGNEYTVRSLLEQEGGMTS